LKYIIALLIVLSCAVAWAGQTCVVGPDNALAFTDEVPLRVITNASIPWNLRMKQALAFAKEGKIFVLRCGTMVQKVKEHDEIPADQYVAEEGGKPFWILQFQVQCGKDKTAQR